MNALRDSVKGDNWPMAADPDFMTSLAQFQSTFLPALRHAAAELNQNA